MYVFLQKIQPHLWHLSSHSILKSHNIFTYICLTFKLDINFILLLLLSWSWYLFKLKKMKTHKQPHQYYKWLYIYASPTLHQMTLGSPFNLGLRRIIFITLAAANIIAINFSQGSPKIPHPQGQITHF
jgi:hypothetical protein